MSTGPVGSWLFVHKRLVRVVIVSLAGLVVLLAPAPTPPLVVTVALVAGALVALLELVARRFRALPRETIVAQAAPRIGGASGNGPFGTPAARRMAGQSSTANRNSL